MSNATEQDGSGINWLRAIYGLLKGLFGFLWRMAEWKSQTPFLDSGAAFDDLATPATETGDQLDWNVTSSSTPPSAEDLKTLAWAYQEGSWLMALQQYGQAAAAYTEGLKVARKASDKARLCYNRSAAFTRLSKLCRFHPERRAACAGPFKKLSIKAMAELAQKDAYEAMWARIKWPKAHLRLGAAEYRLGNTWAAEQALLSGLQLDALSKPLQIALREVRGEACPSDSNEDGTTGGTTAAAAASSDTAGAATDPAVDPLL